ncbi:hypothetical protein ES703_25440 [subsurface metagenome]
MALKRAQVIGLMRGAFRRGQSATSFLWDMRERGLSYRRTDMLSDWRSINELESKADLLRYVRKDYYPTEKTIAQVDFALSHEYMYKVKVQTRLKPDEPLTERFVNIMADEPQTPAQIEELAWRMMEARYGEIVSQVEKITPWTAVQRIS